MQHIAGHQRHAGEEQQRIGQERIAADRQHATVGEPEQRRAAEAQRAALHDRLRNPAQQQHAPERDDEGL